MNSPTSLGSSGQRFKVFIVSYALWVFMLTYFSYLEYGECVSRGIGGGLSLSVALLYVVEILIPIAIWFTLWRAYGVKGFMVVLGLPLCVTFLIIAYIALLTVIFITIKDVLKQHT